ncbi:hypothetical protein P280DRAFT_307270 [Massarina eburnea CBS 473.64]|uniref:Uncharacterized protein n=1 Tax=Massarina eburnea CBS 473.64 TaxID=1395130 RepID=A0A6A6S551_9PLEO|nr:hypothetical protein P280DRAFT_307270 [Massarina eburnea CBS 473.64]
MSTPITPTLGGTSGLAPQQALCTTPFLAYPPVLCIILIQCTLALPFCLLLPMAHSPSERAVVVHLSREHFSYPVSKTMHASAVAASFLGCRLEPSEYTHLYRIIISTPCIFRNLFPQVIAFAT